MTIYFKGKKLMTIYVYGEYSDFHKMVLDRYGSNVLSMYRSGGGLTIFYYRDPNYVPPEGKTVKEMTSAELYDALGSFKHVATWSHNGREGWIFD